MVFLPLKDDNKLRYISFQFATVVLIVINVLVFVWQNSLGDEGVVKFAMSAGVIPKALVDGAKVPAEFALLPPEVTLITYMFLHGDWWHLIGNMLFLWVFGDNVEDAMGALRFVLFYLICGVIAGLAHVYSNVGSEAPLIGASGATAGVVGAYMMLFPRVRMWSLAFMRIPLKLPAYWVILAWLAVQIYFVFVNSEDGTAWWAHIGGFGAGVVLVLFFKRADHPLFGDGTASR